jgi:DNA-binding MarR family transcriptional regulator
LDSGALRGVLGFHLARASVSTVDTFARHIGKPFGLDQVEFSVLLLLLANEDVSPKLLAKKMRVAAPKLSLLLDRLQERGLLQRRPNPADGRSQHLLLTRSGRQLAAQTAAAAQAMDAEINQRLSKAEHAMLIELLDKLTGLPAP